MSQSPSNNQKSMLHNRRIPNRLQHFQDNNSDVGSDRSDQNNINNTNNIANSAAASSSSSGLGGGSGGGGSSTHINGPYGVHYGSTGNASDVNDYEIDNRSFEPGTEPSESSSRPFLGRSLLPTLSEGSHSMMGAMLSGTAGAVTSATTGAVNSVADTVGNSGTGTGAHRNKRGNGDLDETGGSSSEQTTWSEWMFGGGAQDDKNKNNDELNKNKANLLTGLDGNGDPNESDMNTNITAGTLGMSNNATATGAAPDVPLGDFVAEIDRIDEDHTLKEGEDPFRGSFDGNDRKFFGESRIGKPVKPGKGKSVGDVSTGEGGTGYGGKGRQYFQDMNNRNKGKDFPVVTALWLVMIYVAYLCNWLKQSRVCSSDVHLENQSKKALALQQQQQQHNSAHNAELHTRREQMRNFILPHCTTFSNTLDDIVFTSIFVMESPICFLIIMLSIAICGIHGETTYGPLVWSLNFFGCWTGSLIGEAAAWVILEPKNFYRLQTAAAWIFCSIFFLSWKKLRVLIELLEYQKGLKKKNVFDRGGKNKASNSQQLTTAGKERQKQMRQAVNGIRGNTERDLDRSTLGEMGLQWRKLEKYSTDAQRRFQAVVRFQSDYQIGETTRRKVVVKYPNLWFIALLVMPVIPCYLIGFLMIGRYFYVITFTIVFIGAVGAASAWCYDECIEYLTGNAKPWGGPKSVLKSRPPIHRAMFDPNDVKVGGSLEGVEIGDDWSELELSDDEGIESKYRTIDLDQLARLVFGIFTVIVLILISLAGAYFGEWRWSEKIEINVNGPNSNQLHGNQQHFDHGMMHGMHGDPHANMMMMHGGGDPHHPMNGPGPHHNMMMLPGPQGPMGSGKDGKGDGKGFDMKGKGKDGMSKGPGKKDDGMNKGKDGFNKGKDGSKGKDNNYDKGKNGPGKDNDGKGNGKGGDQTANKSANEPAQQQSWSDWLMGTHSNGGGGSGYNKGSDNKKNPSSESDSKNENNNLNDKQSATAAVSESKAETSSKEGAATAAASDSSQKGPDSKAPDSTQKQESNKSIAADQNSTHPSEAQKNGSEAKKESDSGTSKTDSQKTDDSAKADATDKPGSGNEDKKDRKKTETGTDDTNKKTETGGPETDTNKKTETGGPETDTNKKTETGGPETDTNKKTETEKGASGESKPSETSGTEPLPDPRLKKAQTKAAAKPETDSDKTVSSAVTEGPSAAAANDNNKKSSESAAASTTVDKNTSDNSESYASFFQYPERRTRRYDYEQEM